MLQDTKFACPVFCSTYMEGKYFFQRYAVSRIPVLMDTAKRFFQALSAYVSLDILASTVTKVISSHSYFPL